MDGAHPLSTLMVVRSLDVNKDPFRPQEKNEELHGPKISYLSAIGETLEWDQTHVMVSKREYQYGIIYSKDCNPDLVGYADAGYLSDSHKARSQTGYVFICEDTAISWRSIKQSIAATLSNHAEIKAIHKASRECVWLRSIIHFIRKKYGLECDKVPTILYEDNAAVYPIDASISPDENFKRWKYVDYNFTLATYWSPFLIKMKEANADGPTKTGLFNLYLDEADEKWANQIEEFDYVIFNGGHWFSRCSVYYENNQLVGCRYCGLPNVTDLPSAYGYQRAIRTVLRTINNSENFKGMIFLRTFAPSHFEGGEWNNGGNCVRRRPFTNNETSLEGLNLELYTIQVEEFKAAENEGKKKGKRFRLLDTTQAMLLRPDGHPSKYGHWQNENVVLYNDCVHWCLPGPIDSWSDFLLHMLKFEGRGSHEEKPQFMNQ
ncbi:Protein trichome birefringence-like 21 [Capsicum chinense]|nr:Protein trichome birefringence-like 21 [Capsicum chinense]